MSTTQHNPQIKLPVHVRWMCQGDLAEVVAIERASFEHAWSEQDFRDYGRLRNYTTFVAKHRDQVVGYMVYFLGQRKLQLVNFCVAPGYRRLGVGRQMVGKLWSKLEFSRRRVIALEVSDANLDAHLFWKALGFRAERVLRGYYDRAGQDAYVFVYRLQPPVCYPLNRLSAFGPPPAPREGAS